MPHALTESDHLRARRLLMRRDPVLAAIIRRVGPCRLFERQRADPFAALIEAIVWQQLSTKAAATIHGKLLALFDGGRPPSPAELLAAPVPALRAAGLSRAKVTYLHDLAAKVGDGTVRLATLDALDDEAVVATLTQVKGIGRWSAEMFLMFRLHRPDVLPVGDLGIVRAFQRAYRLRKPPSPARMQRIAEAWRPFRSVASWYLWASLENAPMRNEGN